MVTEAAVKSGLPESSLKAFVTTFLGAKPAEVAKIPGVDAAVLAAVAEASKGAYYKSFR
jgi:hypothetical protein